MSVNVLLISVAFAIISKPIDVYTMTTSEDVYYAPSLFLNHGAGPMPVLGEKNNIEIGNSLRNVSQIVDLPRLAAIIVVTAHREEDIVTISSGKRHNLLYDYTNFPPESYKFKYDAPGDPVLAGRIHEALKQNCIPSRLDEERGWDHGIFIPMMLINPAADITIVQVSILKNQDAKEHFELGRVLHQFRREGVAIFGSGLSYHNVPNLVETDNTNNVIYNEPFNTFLTDVCTGDINRQTEILNWDKQPGALESHPKNEADHLMPLIVNIGASGSNPGRKIFDSIFYNKFRISGFIWD